MASDQRVAPAAKRLHPQKSAATEKKSQKPSDLSHDEQRYLDATTKWQQKNGAYALIQGARPYTLAPGLNDSPAGLASWIVDKFHAWSDCDVDVEKSFTKDELLTNVTLYWVTETIGSSFLPYADFVNAGALTWTVEAFRQWVGSTEVPAAFAMFPKDISHPPREWAERFFNVQTLDRDAARRTFRCDGRTRTARRRHPAIFSSVTK
jgi:hypothetical protein